MLRWNLLILLWAALPAASQEAASPRKTLTLEDALALAEQYNPRLKAAAAFIDGAEAGILTARAYQNPDVSLGGFGGQRSHMAGAPSGFIGGWAVNQPLELPSLRRARVRTAELGRETGRFALAETRLTVRAGVMQAFYDTLRRKGEVELAHDNLQLLEDLERRVGVQVKVGEAARLELVRAEAEVATARIQLESGRLRLKTARAALHAAIGAPNGVEFDPRDSLHPPVPLPALDVLRRQVLGAHPSVALADNELRRADSRLALERELLKPQPTVWADMFRQPDVTQYRAGVTLPIPLWNKRQGPIAEAVAAQRQTAAIADMRRLEIQAALEAAYGQYEVASQQVTMFEAGTLKEAEAAVSAAEAAFRFGERGILEVLDAQRVLRGARLEYLNAQFDRESALIALEQLGAIEPRSKKP
ncbi:MAG: TolC family protein [Acidobacteria bacterium]|nr:TolC family protein [Acidobacteriota bacterium]